MPNPTISPKAFAIILLASIGQDVSGFIVQIPEHLLMEVSKRAVNFGIQYGVIAIGQAAVDSKFVDPGAPNPNQKPTKYKQIRTRVNEENKQKFGDIVEEILQDPNTEPYPDVSMRGIKGHGYYSEDYGESGFFVGIHNEGEFTGQIKKAQPISDKQLKTLQEQNRMD